MASATLGFVGIGKMGVRMVSRLLNAGHTVCIFDVSRDAMASMEKLGAYSAGSAVEVASTAETVFLSLPNPQIVENVALASRGLIEGNTVKRVIDFSTIGPRAARRVADGLSIKGIAYVDAPVSGGLKGAHEGTLSIMVACPKTVYSDAEELLKNFGKAFHLGETPGQAQTMKLVNNLLAGAAIALTSEAMVMGVKAGLDPRVMLDVLNASTGRNSATQDKFPRSVLTGTFDFGFSTGLSYKDISLCVDEAEALGVPMVVGSAVRQMLAVTKAMYGADSDFTSMCRVVESWGGVKVRG
ncbi:MAG: NAD-binding protein [Burkholderiales bacterium]|nr:NAD-binding protein [Burkholderiales bacterium]